MDHELGGQTTGLAGTWGYMAPEYISTRKASKETDVYSFGIVALEIATGKKSVDTMAAECQKGLLECVWDLYGQGRLLSAVDERLQMDYEEKQVECLMVVGLWCAHPDCHLRPSISQAIQLQFPRFEPDSLRILYQGDAMYSAGYIEFNRYDYLCRVGHITYVESMQIWDSGSSTLSNFSTHFMFLIYTSRQPTYGQGLAFSMAPVGFQIPPNSYGVFLGLFNTTTSNSTRNQMIAMEFDSYSNPEWDLSFQHIGININSIASAIYTPWNASLHSGDTADAWIIYNANTKALGVFWSYSTEPDFAKNSNLSFKVDLAEVLLEWVTIEFSAATEFGWNLESKTSHGNNAKMMKLVVGLVIPIGVMILGGTIIVLIYWKKRKSKKENPEAEGLTSFNDELERGAGPRRFSYVELASTTNNFSAERKLGEGGFGGVYKGYLMDIDMAIAVKKFSWRSKEGKTQYTTEVKVISRLRHRNLVQLIGWCHETGELLLVYEFMPNGNLDSHLFGNRVPLSWSIRYKVALGLASTLLYLHEEWEQCVVH
ncbi:hypothetical protein Ancab_026207 [Ancistrocladus abbreviatus]